jgi:hypothetical protein
MHRGDGGGKKYWKDNGRNFAEAVMKHLNDDNPWYVDGSYGGVNSIFSNKNPYTRMQYGRKQAKLDAATILKMITDGNGNIKETIKIITHSMGTAYARGYIYELILFFIENDIPLSVIEFEADFAPYQGELLDAHNSFPIYQFSHRNDNIAGNNPMPGAINMDTSADKEQGHSIDSFWEQIRNLPSGSYRVEDGQIVPK